MTEIERAFNYMDIKKRYENNLNGFMLVSVLKNILVNEEPFIY